MTRILVAWEDLYFEAMAALVKKVVRATASPPDSAPTVLSFSPKGNGNFERYVHDTWPNVRGKGLSTAPGHLDHLVCVVDGDRLHDLLPAVAKRPSDPDAVAPWLAQAEVQFTTWLRERCPPSGPPATTVHGFVLRWSRESLVLAGYDQPSFAARLGVDVAQRTVADMLSEFCKPKHPNQVPPARFTDTFVRPAGCLQALRKAAGRPPIDKNAPDIDDVIRDLSKEGLAIVRSRVPDLDRFAALVTQLASPTPPSPAPPPPPTSTAPPPARPPRIVATPAAKKKPPRRS
jgi:hypothetical protein